MPKPPIRPLHRALQATKLATFRKVSTEALIGSLEPGRPGALKVKADGTLMDGHHRLEVLRERGVDVDGLPRETYDPNDTDQDG